MTVPDPWKGFRGVMAAILVLEALSVLLTLLVVKTGDSGRAGSTAVLVLAGAMVLTTRFLARRWAIGLVVGLQVATIAAGFLLLELGLVGVIFGAVWALVLCLRRDVARRMARGELPSQRR